MQYLVQARALENHIYYAAVNRVGEAGFHFIGLSRIVAPNGDLLAASESDRERCSSPTIDPERPRQKRVVNIPGLYEVDPRRRPRPECTGLSWSTFPLVHGKSRNRLRLISV